MKKFEGIYTALLTPFDENGRINENALSDLIEYNLSSARTVSIVAEAHPRCSC